MGNIREAQSSDLLSCLCITQAAFAKDPFFRLISDSEEWYRDLMASIVRNSFAYGQNYVLASTNVEGFLALKPPGGPALPWNSETLAGKYSPGLLAEFNRIWEEAGEACASMFDSAWYLALLAVNPALQQTGRGNQLLQFAWRKAEPDHGTLVLTTNTERDCGFYEHRGFRLFGSRTLTANGCSIPEWSFLRRAD